MSPKNIRQFFFGTIPHWDPPEEVLTLQLPEFFFEVIFLGANGLQQFALSGDLSHQQGPGPLDLKRPSLETQETDLPRTMYPYHPW